MPSKENYHPIEDAHWVKDQPVPYSALAQTLYCMEKTTKRLELLSIITNYFRSVLALSPKDLVPSMYILTNKVAPDYDSLELGIGDTVLFKALAEATGSTTAKLKVEFQNKGDIGLVAEANRCNQKLIFTPKKLTVGAVFSKFKEIAQISGNSVCVFSFLIYFIKMMELLLLFKFGSSFIWRYKVFYQFSIFDF